MNIEKTLNPKITSSSTVSVAATSASKTNSEDSAKFSDELTALSKKEDVEKTKQEEKTEPVSETEDKKVKEEEVESEDVLDKASETEKAEAEDPKDSKDENKGKDAHQKQDGNSELDDILNGLQNTVEEISKVKNPDPSLDHLDENQTNPIKNLKPNSDKNKNDEDNTLINNDMNIQESKEQIMPQMNSGMNFDTNGQPFREFINNQQQELALSEQDLAEESAILSTMSENLAIASKNMLLSKNNTKEVKKEEPVVLNRALEIEQDTVQSKVKTVSNEQGVKRVDTKTNVTVETVVKYDNLIMNEGDVEFFTKLVENGSLDMNSMNTQHASKSSQVSKTLADMLAKSMRDNQPIRIDFDNNISVIIKVSRQGKISADFLPSSQVAEAYLKENLPLLKQRFDDNNIEYDELNQRRQRQDEKEDRKKGRKDE